MKQLRTFPRFTVTRKQERSIRSGHPWVYEDEITKTPESLPNGSIVDVLSEKGKYLGSGFYSASSRIKIRLLSNNANETFDDAFYQRRVAYALQYRKDVMKEDFNACRLIHGEADGLPGLTIDRYNNILVSQVESYGTELHRDVIYRALTDQLSAMGETIDGIYERNEGSLRKKEGLVQYKAWYGINHPSSCIAHINENGINYDVDVENGQKTGFFLDQKYNRKAIMRLAEGKRVLDCCTHTGSFALNAAKGKADKVLAMDISETALEMAEVNAEKNNLHIETRQGDVFEVLPALREEQASFDLIVLDPPAFTKSRRTFEHAYNGYREINADAMRLLPRGGYLATASCSHFMPKEEFEKMLVDASRDAGVSFRIVERRGASPDHPVMPVIPETEYLKFFILQIV